MAEIISDMSCTEEYADGMSKQFGITKEEVINNCKKPFIELRIKGEILPDIKSLQFLLIDCLDGKMTLQISNKITDERQIMIIDSDEFYREIESLLKLKKENGK
jgi:hypothetical protein